VRDTGEQLEILGQLWARHLVHKRRRRQCLRIWRSIRCDLVQDEGAIICDPLDVDDRVGERERGLAQVIWSKFQVPIDALLPARVVGGALNVRQQKPWLCAHNTPKCVDGVRQDHLGEDLFRNHQITRSRQNLDAVQIRQVRLDELALWEAPEVDRQTIGEYVCADVCELGVLL